MSFINPKTVLIGSVVIMKINTKIFIVFLMTMMTILNIRDPLRVNKIIYNDNNKSLLNDKEYDHKENIFNSYC